MACNVRPQTSNHSWRPAERYGSEKSDQSSCSVIESLALAAGKISRALAIVAIKQAGMTNPTSSPLHNSRMSKGLLPLKKERGERTKAKLSTGIARKESLSSCSSAISQSQRE